MTKSNKNSQLPFVDSNTAKTVEAWNTDPISVIFQFPPPSH